MSRKDDEIGRQNIKIDKMANSIIGVQGPLERFVLDKKEKDIWVTRTTDRPLQTQDISRNLPIMFATCISNVQRLQQIEAEESEQKFTLHLVVASLKLNQVQVTNVVAQASFEFTRSLAANSKK
uniref:Uncharacterized protein n=1 Tax=Romanomermis culicivorax TaxID=13658 RepID=A0A915HR65_ROMCU